jgi:hypothetical protein
MIFTDALGMKIYCSRAARRGTQSFIDLKQGKTHLPEPSLADVVTGIAFILYQAIRGSSARP